MLDEVDAFLAQETGSAVGRPAPFVGVHARVHHFQIPMTAATMRSFWRCTMRGAMQRNANVFLATNDRSVVLDDEWTSSSHTTRQSLRGMLMAEYAPVTPCARSRVTTTAHHAVVEMHILTRSAVMHVWTMSSFSEMAWNIGGLEPPNVIDERCTPLPSTAAASPDMCLHFQPSCTYLDRAAWPIPSRENAAWQASPFALLPRVDAAFFGWCSDAARIDFDVHLSQLSPACGCYNPQLPRRSWNCAAPYATCGVKECYPGACCPSESFQKEIGMLVAQAAAAAAPATAPAADSAAAAAPAVGSGAGYTPWGWSTGAQSTALDDDACACVDACEWRRTAPQDPLKWCTVKSVTCIQATRGGAEHDDAGRGASVKAWRHCGGAHEHWQWPAVRFPVAVPQPKGLGYAAERDSLNAPFEAKDESRAMHANLAAARQVEVEAAGATAPTTRAGRKLRHYVVQTDCAPDGLGANFNYIKVGLFVASQMNMHLVWNPANFVSENTPQYVGEGSTLAFPLESPPGDTFTPFGFHLYPPSAGITPAELYAWVHSGALVARPIDVFDSALGKWPMQRGAEHAAMFTERLSAAIETEGWNVEGAKERALIIRSCEASYRGWDIGGVGDWMRAAFHATRQLTRPSLPLAALGPSTFLIGVHVRLGDCAFARWKKSGVCKSFPWQTAVNMVLAAPLATAAGAPPQVLRCGAGSGSAARVAIVAQATRADLDAAFLEQHAACTELVLSSVQDQAVASARAVFDALDALASSDIVVLSPSSFSRLAGALASPAAVKLAPFPDDEVWAKASWAGLNNVVEMCGSGANAGEFDAAALAAAWSVRYASEQAAPLRAAPGAC